MCFSTASQQAGWKYYNSLSITMTPSKTCVSTTSQQAGWKYYNSPQYNNDAIEDVESILDIAEQAVRDELKEHLHGEKGREHQVAYLQGLGQLRRLENLQGFTFSVTESAIW